MGANAGARSAALLGAYVDEKIFPCSRMEILRCAEDNEAPDAILDAIEDLPERNYWSVTEIISSFALRGS